MPTISFTFDAAVATRLQDAGIDKARVIELVRADLAANEARAARETEEAKVQAAQDAASSAIETAVDDAKTVTIT